MNTDKNRGAYPCSSAFIGGPMFSWGATAVAICKLHRAGIKLHHRGIEWRERDADQETCRYPLFRDHAEAYLYEPAQLSGRGAGRVPGCARIAVALRAGASGDEAAQRAEEQVHGGREAELLPGGLHLQQLLRVRHGQKRTLGLRQEL